MADAERPGSLGDEFRGVYCGLGGVGIMLHCCEADCPSDGSQGTALGRLGCRGRISRQ